MVDDTNLALAGRQQLQSEQRPLFAVALVVKATANAAVRFDQHRAKAMLVYGLPGPVAEEASHRVAPGDPGGAGRHRETHVVMQQRDDGVQIALLPRPDVALE